jgi:hypothetical protein
VDRWPSPRALLDLCFPSGDGKWICKGLLARARLGVGSTNGPALVTFASPTETQSGVRCPSILLVLVGPPCGKRPFDFLDLGSSHGVVIDLPLHRYRCLVSTPSDTAAPKSGHRVDLQGDLPRGAVPLSARSCHLPDSFRPCRSSRLRRFTPPGTSQVCCTLKPIMGFAKLRVVGALWLHLVPTSSDRSRCSSPPPHRNPEGCPGLDVAEAFACALPKTSTEHPPRRGGQETSSNRSRWRSTLRSFPLAVSSLTSTAVRVRTPIASAALGKPEYVGDALRVVRPRGHGPPRNLPSRRWSRATQLPYTPRAVWRGASSTRFLDLKALIRQRVRCDCLRCSKQSPDAPLGFAPRRSVPTPPCRCESGPAESRSPRTPHRSVCPDFASMPFECRAEARAAGEPTTIRSTADQPLSVQFRRRQAASDPADPTNTCSRRSAIPRGIAPDATSSGLPLSSSHGDRATHPWQPLPRPGGRRWSNINRSGQVDPRISSMSAMAAAPLRPGGRRYARLAEASRRHLPAPSLRSEPRSGGARMVGVRSPPADRPRQRPEASAQREMRAVGER